MKLEDYFDFLSPDDIRIHGSRAGIENVLYEFIHRARTPEEIAETFPTISLEEVYATILYYLHNKTAVHNYFTAWLEFGRKAREEQRRNPPPELVELQRRIAEVRKRRKVESR